MHLLVDSSSASEAILLVRDLCGLKDIKSITADSQHAPALINGPICFHSMIAITKSLAHLGERPELLGVTPEDAAFVEQWLIIASRIFYTNSDPSPKLLDDLNSQLLSSVYLIGNQITLADIILYAALHSTMKNVMSQAQKSRKFLNLCRWFDHIYHTSAQLDTALPEIPFYIPSTIFTSDFSKSLPSKGSSKEKKNKKEVKNTNTENKKQKKKNEKQQNKKDAKNKKDTKKEKKNKKQKAKPAAGGADNSWRLNVVVGKIKSARKHKTEGDRMFVSEIDCGEEKCRMVVMGVASFCKEEDLKDRVVMVIINVKAGELKGEFSNGRVLVATSSDKTAKEIVKVPDGAKIGERIKLGSSEKPPDAAISNKNMHKILKQLNTSSKGVAQYADYEFLTSAGPCIAPTIMGGTLA